mgnify:CR=1 FL=1
MSSKCKGDRRQFSEVGISSIFTASVPSAAKTTATLALFVPQGWVMRAWQLTMQYSAWQPLLVTFGVIVLWSAAFFLIGRARLQKRFA